MSKTEFFTWDVDLPGFGIRHRAGGSVTYVYQYKVGKKQRRVTIGRVKEIPPEVARALAKEGLLKARLAHVELKRIEASA